MSDQCERLFRGFRRLDVEGAGARIRVRIGGAGPPILLLHGYPQTHAMWHALAVRLRDRYTLVCADLRGYGDSEKPSGGPGHAAYSKRAMAADMAAVMRSLGYERFYVAGHDRGGRVAHRLAIDHPDAVIRWATLDIAPTREMYRGTNEAFARGYWHWFFLILPAPLPERMIGADPDAWWRKKCGSGSAGMNPFHPDALAEYLRCFRDPDTIRATCEDYRAEATIDIAHDDADGEARAAAPLLAIWGENGVVGRCFDVADLWSQRVIHVEPKPLPGGHYLAEELPDEVASALSGFFCDPP